MTVLLILFLIVAVIAIIFVSAYLKSKEDTKIGRQERVIKEEIKHKVEYQMRISEKYSMSNVPYISTSRVESGIYLIYVEDGLGNFLPYIGQAKDIRARFMQHRRELIAASERRPYIFFKEFIETHNKTLDDIVFVILEICNESELTERENYWMSEYKTQDKGANTADSKRREDVVIRIEGNEKLLNTFRTAQIYKVHINVVINVSEINKGSNQFRSSQTKTVTKIKRGDYVFAKNIDDLKTLELNEEGDIIDENGELVSIMTLSKETVDTLLQLTKEQAENEEIH